MNSKRILAALMSVFMLVSFALPALAYTTPFESAVVDEWKPAFILDGSSNKATYTDGTLNYQITGSAQATYSGGVVRLVNSSSANSNYTHTGTANIGWTTSSEKYVNPEKGVTLDAYLKIDNLPKITSDTYLRDDGVNFDSGMPFGILFGGLAFQILCRSASWTGDSGHKNNVTQGVMVLYDNETLGTNAAFIMGVGVRAGTGANTMRPVTFFFNLPEGEYARYTFKYDVVNGTTRFYVNGVAQKYDGTDSVDANMGLMYYANSTVVGNAFNLCLNGPGHASTKDNSAEYYCDVTMDQIAIFGDAITPDGTNAGKFLETVPLDFIDLNAWLNVYRDLDPKNYSTSSWQAIEDAVDAVNVEKEGLLQSEVIAWTNALKAAIMNREYIGLDRLYIGSTASSANPSTTWTCGAMLITEAGYSLQDYNVNGMYLNSWTRIIAQHVAGGVYRVTKVVEGAYRNGNKPAIGDDEVVPENGFIFAFHSNEESAAWNPIEGGSQYAAQEFGERNAYAFRNLNIKEGSFLSLENVVVNYAGDSTLSTEGTWIHRYAEGVDPTPIYRTSGQVNGEAAEGDPQYLARDQFDNFETASYIKVVDALPNLKVGVEGNGTVVYGEDVIDSAESKAYTLETGTVVTLTAQGENFSYWKNAKNNAIISSSAELTVKALLSELEVVAVFEESESVDVVKHVVTFKDGITGKILKNVEVEEGTLVDAALIPEITAIYGQTFVGWYVEGSKSMPIDSTAITGNTTFVAIYTANYENTHKLTVVIGDTTLEFNRPYGTLAVMGAPAGAVSYWTLDGSFLSSAQQAQLSMPDRDVVVTAVYADEELNFAPTTTLLSSFVDENGNLMATFSRDIPEGYTFVESGILMTRKGTPDDLTIDTLVASVTKGISTATSDRGVYGFTKPDMFAKAGNWYLRGYLTYKDANGTITTVYSVTHKLAVADAAVEGEVYQISTVFDIDGELDATKYGTEVFNALAYSDSGYKAFFPSTTQADDGTLFVVYYYGPGHAYYKQTEGKLAGVLHMQKSTDNGMTWSDPEVLVDLTDEDTAKGDYNRESRDPNLQKLSDGTLVLTFPVRAPIGKAGLNGSTLNDYWYERAYYMTSVDNGKTWSEMKEIECDYLSGGEPYLYDDPNRTTACWVKNGSIAELDNGDLIFPLYGAVDCSSRAILQTVVVKAKNNGDGTFTFYKDWADGKDAAQVAGEGLGDELAVWAYGDTVYGFARNKINSDYSLNTGGIVYRSLDAGKTWAQYAVENTANNCVNQPNFAALTDDLVLVNYAVPLASVNGSFKRSARPVYGKLFDLSTGDWNKYSAIPVIDVVNAGQTNNDMGNPASVLMDDGRIFTVGYSNPSNGASVIVGQYSTISDYGKATASGGDVSGTLILEENFDDVVEQTYLSVNNAAAVSGGAASSSAPVTDELTAVINNYSKIGAASISVEDGKLVLWSNNRRISSRPTAQIQTGNLSGSVSMKFDYSFADTTADGGTEAKGNRLYINLFDDAQKDFYITPGAIILPDASVVTFAATANTEYTFKVLYLEGTLLVKAWVKGDAEPAEWMGSCTTTLGSDLPISLEYHAGNPNSTTVRQDRSMTIDNLSISQVSVDLKGLVPADGLTLKAGKTARLKAAYDTPIAMSGTVEAVAYSDNPAVVKLNSDGTVTAVSSGVANVIATVEGKTYIATITVL